jgi:hypothetical protein
VYDRLSWKWRKSSLSVCIATGDLSVFRLAVFKDYLTPMFCLHRYYIKDKFNPKTVALSPELCDATGRTCWIGSSCPFKAAYAIERIYGKC